MRDFIAWARRLLALPLLARYPSHLRCFIINGTNDFITNVFASLRDFVMVRSRQLLPLGCFHDFCSVKDPISMIMLAFLSVVRSLLRPIGCCFIGCRPRYIMFLLREDLAEHFRWRVRFLNKATDIVKLSLAYLTKVVPCKTMDRYIVV